MDGVQHGIVCEHHSHINYSLSFTTIEDNGDILVPSSVLDIAVPLTPHQESTTLCLECQGANRCLLQVPGEKLDGGEVIPNLDEYLWQL